MHQNQTYGGFVRNTDGSIVLVNYPGANETDWLGFAASGQIAGRYMDSAYLRHGCFGPVSGPYTRFDVAGANQTSPVASNSAGQRVAQSTNLIISSSLAWWAGTRKRA